MGAAPPRSARLSAGEPPPSSASLTVPSLNAVASDSYPPPPRSPSSGIASAACAPGDPGGPPPCAASSTLCSASPWRPCGPAAAACNHLG